MNDGPKLLVEWSSPWHEFLTSIRPALARSEEPLGGEARTDLFPYRGMLLTWGVEVGLLVLLIVLPARFARMRPFQPPAMPKYDVIYFSGDELPQTGDRGGARAGRSGRAGGRESHHRTQTIRVARGESLRAKVVDAPKLNLALTNADVANLLAYKAVPGPAPTEGMASSSRAPELSQTAVAPAPEVRREKMQAVPTLTTSVIPPSATIPRREMESPRVPGSNAVQVIPPPVSAPEAITISNPRLTLPAPLVVAPAPTQVSRDLRSMGPGFDSGELHKQIVPPPAQLPGDATDRRSVSGLGNPSVVAPPVQARAATTDRRGIAGLGNPSVVPPPAQVNDGGVMQHQPVSGLGGGTAVVPPPPTFSANGSSSRLGSGSRGSGLGGAMDAGSLAAPPSHAGGSGGGTGIVVSNQPGSKVGAPGNGGAGSLAMSPAGGAKPGLGGSGGGTGIGHGSGTGSGLSGEGSGATTEGTGRGSDAAARSGISPYPGSGGAGNLTSGTPAMPGVSVHGGSNIVTLPSFGGAANQPSDPSRSSTKAKHTGPAITIVGTSRSGGAFNFYGTLKGDKVYTIYIDTALGTAVMEYADAASAAHPYAEDLTAPQPLRADLPPNLARSRLIIACILDRSGAIHNPQVLESDGSEMTGKVLAALSHWKFSPALRGDQPVEVNAILGFDIDTR